METFSYQTLLPFSAEEVFRWHARPGAFERLRAPWTKIYSVRRTGLIEPGTRVTFRQRLGPVSFSWVVHHVDSIPNRQFREIALLSPFSFWRHTHRFEPAGEQTCRMIDNVDFEYPFGRVGRALASSLVLRELNRAFAYAHRVVAGDLRLHGAYSQGSPLRILVSGASGLIGSALVNLLRTGGHKVTALTRNAAGSGAECILWNPERGELDTASLEGFDAVVHLAGESIAQGRWTAQAQAADSGQPPRGNRAALRTAGRNAQASACPCVRFGHRVLWQPGRPDA